jgi:hypothetical protein
VVVTFTLFAAGTQFASFTADLLAVLPPCTQPWQPLNANMRAFWPAYLGLVLFITQALPRLMLLLGGSPSFVAVAVPVFGAGAFLLRSRQPPAPEENDE